MHETEPWTVHAGYMLAAPHLRKLILLNSTDPYGYCLTLNEASNKALRHWTASRYRRNGDSNAGDWLTTSENTTEFRFTTLEAYLNELQKWLPPLPYLSLTTALEPLLSFMDSIGHYRLSQLRDAFSSYTVQHPLVWATHPQPENEDLFATINMHELFGTLSLLSPTGEHA